MVGLVSNTEHEVMVEEQWDVGAEFSLLDFEIFRLLKPLLVSEMDICPTHASPITPLATGSYAHLAKAQASAEACGPIEITEQLGLQKGLRVCW